MSRLSFVQELHLQKLHILNRSRKRKVFENAISYDLDFFRFKNGKINISKLARCTGLSRTYIAKKIHQMGL